MKVEAVTRAIQWLVSQGDAQITHAIILTDSVNLLQKVESVVGCPDWHTAMRSLQLQRLLWIYCPGYTRVSGNERADRLASSAYNYHIWSQWSVVWQGRGAPRLEELFQHGQARASQHWSSEGKRSEERKRPTFHPSRSGTICVQPDKHCHCFEGSLGETAERRSAYEPFRALRCHLELKLKLDVSMTIHYWPVLVTSTEYIC